MVYAMHHRAPGVQYAPRILDRTVVLQHPYHMPKCATPLHTASTTISNKISGEWDGVAITFNSRGEATELPHNVVPDAFREWGVTLVAWQTQCSMQHEDDTTIQYTLRRLYPTVGCEGAVLRGGYGPSEGATRSHL